MMELIVFIGTIIVTLIAITSVIMAIAAVVATITTLEDNEQKFFVLYAMFGWFVLGMWIVGFFS